MALPVLSPGDTNRYVLKAKKLAVAHLKKLNKNELAAKIDVSSKVYGANLEKGIRFIQRKYKLTVDGIIGPSTWTVLNYARPPKKPVPVVTVVPRAEWGAKPAKGVEKVKWTGTTVTRVHHTASAAPIGSGKELFEAEKKAVLETQRYHMDSRKYNDIAYNYIICPSGRVFECRGKEVMGAHTLGHNEDCGVAFLGNYGKDELTKAQILAYKALRIRLGISKGAQVAHRKTYSTSCPGDNVVKALGL